MSQLPGPELRNPVLIPDTEVSAPAPQNPPKRRNLKVFGVRARPLKVAPPKSLSEVKEIVDKEVLTMRRKEEREMEINRMVGERRRDKELKIAAAKKRSDDEKLALPQEASLSRIQEHFQHVRPESGTEFYYQLPAHVSQIKDFVVLHEIDPSTRANRLIVKEYLFANSTEHSDVFIGDVQRNGVSMEFREWEKKEREKAFYGGLGAPEDEEAKKEASNQAGTTTPAPPHSTVDSRVPGIFIISDMNAKHETLSLIISTASNVIQHLRGLLGHRATLRPPIRLAKAFRMRKGEFLVHAQKKKRSDKDSTICAAFYVDDVRQIQSQGKFPTYASCKHVYHGQNQEKNTALQRLGVKRKRSTPAPPPPLSFCAIPLNRAEYTSSLCPVHHAEMTDRFKASRLELASSSQSISQCVPLSETYSQCIYQMPTHDVTNKPLAVSIDLTQYRSKEYCDLLEPEEAPMAPRKRKSTDRTSQQRLKQFIHSNNNHASSALSLHMEEQSRQKIESVLLKQLKPTTYFEQMDLTSTVSHLVSNLEMNPELGKDLNANDVLEFEVEDK